MPQREKFFFLSQGMLSIPFIGKSCTNVIITSQNGHQRPLGSLYNLPNPTPEKSPISSMKDRKKWAVPSLCLPLLPGIALCSSSLQVASCLLEALCYLTAEQVEKQCSPLLSSSPWGAGPMQEERVGLWLPEHGMALFCYPVSYLHPLRTSQQRTPKTNVYTPIQFHQKGICNNWSQHQLQD